MKSEFTSLLDMVIARGGVHSDLIAEIHQAVLTQFRQRYPKQPPGVAAVVDETNGEVRIYSGEKNVTPDDFAHEAAGIARRILIEKLDKSPEKNITTESSLPLITRNLVVKTSGIAGWITNIFFWGYNLYFLLLILFTEANWIGKLFSGKFFENIKNVDYLQILLGIVMLATPVSAMYLAIKRKLYSRPGTLGRIFFLFEVPIFLIASLASGIGTQTSLFVQYVLLTLMTIPLILFFYSTDTDPNPTGRKILLFIHQQALVIIGYLVMLFTFVVPLIIGAFGQQIFGDLFDMGINGSSMPYGYSYPQTNIMGMGLGFGLGMVLFGLVILGTSIPYMVFVVIVKAWRKNLAGLEKIMPADKLMRLQGIFLAVIAVIAVSTAIQINNSKYLDMLTRAYESQDIAEQEELVRELLPQEKKLAETIKDFGYTGRRYPIYKDDDTIMNGYRDVFDVSKPVAQGIQDMFINLAYPFVYQGEEVSNYQLGRQYDYIFGHSIYDYDTVSYMTKEMGNVKMNYRKYTVTTETNGLAAKISIEEEYKNKLTTQQEIIYEFTLPEGSVVTELNLGPDLEFPGVIAPKGAAQRVYEAQIQVRRDPALLEQIGPNQYRLRVYPIPGYSDYTTLKGKQQRVQFAYVTPLTKSGYGLPVYQKATNMVADTATVYILEKDGKQEQLNRDITSISTDQDICTISTPTQVNLSGVNWQLAANPGPACLGTNEVLNTISGKNIALIADISTDNKGALAIAEAKTYFKNDGFLTRNRVDLIKFNKISGGATKLTQEALDQDLDLVYFGDADWNKGLPNITADYDVVLIVAAPTTDLSKITSLPAIPTLNTYIVSDKVLPAMSHQLTARLWQGGGGTKTSIVEALTDVAVKLAMDEQIGTINEFVVMKPEGVTDADNLLAFVSPTTGENPTILQALANSVLFKANLGKSKTEVTGNITEMDKYGNFAKAAGIVTPFSSYVALVNEVQKQQLENFEDSYNRYQEQVTNTQIFREITVSDEMQFAPLDAGPIPSMGGIFDGQSQNNAFEIRELSGTSKSGGFGIAGGGSMMSSGGNSFILINVVILGIGSAWYLFRLIRKNKVKK